ncbi:MAG: hypothetical protein Q4D60_11345 [Eubacteriales bacterium]|nr:hypothetical protein [Eubacteriales bacterium]
MTNQYLNNLYRDLLSNSPQTVTIDIPADMGIGQISQIVTKQGAVVSDWKMNYFSDINVQGINSEEYVQLLFCFNDGVSWNIADNRQSTSIQKGESCIYRGHGKMEYLCYAGNSDFLFKNIKIPLSYFYKILNDYFEDSEIVAYEKKLLTGISKVHITPYMEHIFAELKDFIQYRGGLGYLFLESKIFELLSVYLSEVLELSILTSDYGANIHTLYIAQIKRKYGLDMGKNYNLAADPKKRVPQCPRDKEIMLLETLKHFKMLDASVEIMESGNGNHEGYSLK